MKIWEDAVSACAANGNRLLDDAKNLEESGRFASARALAILAQEEFAKAYLLKLVNEGAVPLCEEVMRACRDHSCKHLIALVMLYLFTPIEEMSSRDRRDRYMREEEGFEGLPAHVADALNIFCHEKLRKWRFPNMFSLEDPIYDPMAKRIGKGSLDKEKQNALYVGIGQNGVTMTPHCTAFEAQQTIEVAEKLNEVIYGDVWAFTEKSYIQSAFRAILYDLTEPKI